MKRILMSTALVAMVTAPAFAQTTPIPATSSSVFHDQAVTDAVYASEFIGSTLYVAEADVTDTELAEVSPDWNSVGEVSDLVVAPGGRVEAVLADIGGFLGMGERTVAVDMDAIRVVMDSDTPGDYFLVFASTRDALEQAPKYPMPETVSAAMNPEATATMPASPTMAPGTPTDTATASAPSPMEGYVPVEHAMLTAEQLEGVEIYDANNDSVGDISKVLVAADGKVERIVIDVGGFLGIGAKPVAMPITDLQFFKQAEGETYRASTALTKDQLKEMPGYSDS